VDAYLIDAVRTPFGKHRGGLSGIRTDDLAALPLAALLARHPGFDAAEIDDVILGDTNGAGEDNRNVARMATLLAGLPPSVPGVTVNRLCGSGGEAIIQAARAIRAGDAEVVIAGGVESMSRAPFVMARPDVPFPGRLDLLSMQVGWRMVNPKFPDRWTASLGACAEAVAVSYGIGRSSQDEWALRSHERAAQAWEKGVYEGFAIPVGEVVRDESIRTDTSAEALAALKPAFTKDGTVTAGNASPINDGAVAVLMGPAELAAELDVTPLGRIMTSATVAVEPHLFSVAPVPAIARALVRAGLKASDIHVWEINEAFAAMVLSCLHDLPDAIGEAVDPERVNPNGGAIAIGHPLGASAPRVIVDVCRELRRRGGGYGVAAACIGVGQGVAVVVEVG
jgi:acetyl-CoA acetyltransferase family protein